MPTQKMAQTQVQKINYYITKTTKFKKRRQVVIFWDFRDYVCLEGAVPREWFVYLYLKVHRQLFPTLQFTPLIAPFSFCFTQNLSDLQFKFWLPTTTKMWQKEILLEKNRKMRWIFLMFLIFPSQHILCSHSVASRKEQLESLKGLLRSSRSHTLKKTKQIKTLTMKTNMTSYESRDHLKSQTF